MMPAGLRDPRLVCAPGDAQPRLRPAHRVERPGLGRDGRFTIGAVLTGGSKLTTEFAARHGKPRLHLAKEALGDPAARLREFLAAHAVKVLNVAGSRASKEPEVAAFVSGVLNRVLVHDVGGSLGVVHG